MNDGCFIKGSVPKNKILIQKSLLMGLYAVYGSVVIARKLEVSKQTILRCLHEYGIPIRARAKVLPEYHKKALRVPKSGENWGKGKTKENNKSLLRRSEKLTGSNNVNWRPEIHTGEKVLCECGCGEPINKYDKKGRIRHYKKGHCKDNRFSTENTSGSNNFTWKGGITPKNDRIRKSDQYNQWRLAIYKRDYYTCQECGAKGKKKNIVAHHIKSFADYPELRFDIDNGVTLCRSCHLSIHQKLRNAA